MRRSKVKKFIRRELEASQPQLPSSFARINLMNGEVLVGVIEPLCAGLRLGLRVRYLNDNRDERIVDVSGGALHSIEYMGSKQYEEWCRRRMVVRTSSHHEDDGEEAPDPADMVVERLCAGSCVARDGKVMSWDQHRREYDPPGLTVRQIGVTCDVLVLGQGPCMTSTSLADARAAAWTWYELRLALYNRLERADTTEESPVPLPTSGPLWPRILLWTDEQRDRVERAFAEDLFPGGGAK